MITVVIPSYNHQNYIKLCLEYSKEINFGVLKVIVIDDGSKDDTAKAAREFSEQNPDLEMDVFEKKNSGLVSSLNLALEKVDTEFLYICASDDIPDPVGLSTAISIMKAESKLKFFIGGAKILLDNNDGEVGVIDKNVYTENHSRFFSLEPNQRSVECFLNYPNPILLQSTLFRTEYVKKHNGWDPELVLDDFPFFLKLMISDIVLGKDFLFRPDIICVYYRQHPNNSFKNLYRLFLINRQAIRKLVPKELEFKAKCELTSNYVISALRQMNVVVLWNILRVSGIFETLWSVPLVFRKAFKKIRGWSDEN